MPPRFILYQNVPDYKGLLAGIALVDAGLAKRTLTHGNRQFSHEKYDYPGTPSGCARTRLAQQSGRRRGHAGGGQVNMMTSPTLLAVDYTRLHVYARNGLPLRTRMPGLAPRGKF